MFVPDRLQVFRNVSNEESDMSDEYTDQVRVEMTVHNIISELDDLMVLAAKPATSRYVAGEIVGVGEILKRAQLVANLIEARKSPKLKLVGV
jgi:hypothetical protein